MRHQRKGRVVERQLRREFIPRWADQPIETITPLDVSEVIREAVKRGAIHEAHNLLSVIRRFYTWAINCGAYGLENSPCDRLKPKDVIGVGKTVRKRVLTDEELFRAFWVATGPERMSYPFGPMYRLLAVTGKRKSEVAEATWSEFNLVERLWTIPASRMKGDASHLVPLSDMALAILDSLPRFQKGDHLFSTTFGQKPVSGFSKAKARLDELMWATLGSRDPFVVHDIRRTVRTRLSAALSRIGCASLSSATPRRVCTRSMTSTLTPRKSSRHSIGGQRDCAALLSQPLEISSPCGKWADGRRRACH